MTVQVLTEDQKNIIESMFLSGDWNQTELALMYQTSTRTIHRVLTERGIAPVKPGDAILALCKARGLDAEALQRELNEPTLTENNIINWLVSKDTVILLDVINAVYREKARQDVIKNFNRHPSNVKPL